MRKLPLEFVIFSLFFVIAFPVSANGQCQIGQVSQIDSHKTTSGFKRTGEPFPENTIVVQSDKANIIRGKKIQFEGNVTIFQRQQTVNANSAIYDELTSQFLANGNVQLNSSAATVLGESIFIDEKNKNFELLNADYRFGFNSGRGTAESFSITNSESLNLQSATFTTCPGDDPSWLFKASEINISQDEGWGEAWNTVFKIGEVPILYVPYITFPISEVRKSGLLFPEFGSTNRLGAYYSQPIYFNLAENYDVTITPKYMSQRGWQLATNFRHLSEDTSNILQMEFMNEDLKLQALDERYLGYIQHESSWSENWNLQVQWTELSDDNYISEFKSDYHHQSDTHLNNFAQLSYNTPMLNISFLSQDMVELGAHDPSYKVPLQLEIDWTAFKSNNGFSMSMLSSYSQFANNLVNEHSVERLHAEPEIAYQYYQPAFQFEASASYLATQYKQEFRDSDSNLIDRGIAKYRVLTGLNFEKQTQYFGNSVRQTLEPKLQYVFVEAQDQNGIGLYDSQRLKEDYFALFRSQTYSSIDRIESMNQVTVGVSTSIFDDSNKELFRFGIGQIHKFETNDDTLGTNTDGINSKPSLAIELFGQLSLNWQVDGGLLYDRESEKIDSAFVALDYWLDENKNIQINHRYVRDVADITINQSGLFGSYKLNDNWSIAASYHYDSERDVSLDGLIGFEYRSCCWSVRVSAQRQVVLDLNNTDLNANSEIEYQNGIGINFTLNGLGGDSISKISSLFSNSIFAYRRPYLITK